MLNLVFSEFLLVSCYFNIMNKFKVFMHGHEYSFNRGLFDIMEH